MALFNSGQFTLHSGAASHFLIDCDALTDEDLEALAAYVERKLPKFKRVVGIPEGGLRFAEKLEKYADDSWEATLVVDDVLTTGSSMIETARTLPQPCWGVVIFARGLCPSWIVPIFNVV